MIPLGAIAAPLTPEDALMRLKEESGILKTGAKDKITNLQPAYIGRAAASDSPAWYAFNYPSGGFIIVAADDVAVPLLGYSPSGAFDYEKISPSMKWWMNFYAEEIASASSASEQGRRKIAYARKEKKAIAPMILTRWDQGAPYNMFCPKVDDKPTYTGCVATAQAQLMKYFNYPPKGKGSTSYIWNGQNLSIDFGATTFDWNEMQDRYSTASTEAQNEAVAKLMMACGYSVDMNYGTNESAAIVYDWAPALINYFSYAPSTTPYCRQFYGLYEWEDMIYESLSSGSPVLYAGSGSKGGHAFICDGYDKEGYFHFNWGWSGASDGYYLLSALFPPHLGVGGGDGGFNANQMAVLGIKPDFAGSKAVPMLGLDGFPELSYSNASGNISFSGRLVNYGNAPLKFKVGYEAVNEQNEVFYAGADKSWSELGIIDILSVYSRGFSPKLPDGKYKLRPAYAVAKDGNEDELEWHTTLIPVNYPQYFELEIKGGKGTLAVPDTKMPLVASDFRVEGTPRTNFPFTVKASIRNNSDREAIEDLQLLLLRPDGTRQWSTNVFPLDLPAGETFEFSETVTMTVNPGKYKLALVTDLLTSENSYALLCDPIEITINPGVESLVLTPASFNVTAESAEGGGANVRVETDVVCKEGAYANPIYYWIGSTNNWNYSFRSETVVLEENDTVKVVTTTFFPDGKHGESYELLANYVNLQNSFAYYDKKKFTVGTAGIDSAIGENEGLLMDRGAGNVVINSAAEILTVSVFGLDGMQMRVSAERTGSCSVAFPMHELPHGVYVAKVYTAGGVRTYKFAL